MSLKYQRPNGAYTGDSSLSNRTKYQGDASAEPKVAISSAKVDGDFNYVIDVLNEIDQAAGTRASIDDRLSVSMNSDGTLKATVAATLDDWLALDLAGLARVNDSTFQVDGDLTTVFAAGQRVRLTVSSLYVFAHVGSSSYSGDVTQVTCLDIVNSAGDSTVIGTDPTAVAYGPLVVGTAGNCSYQFENLKVRSTTPVLRLKDIGGAEYGLRVGASSLEFVRNTGTETSPTWSVQGQVSAEGLVMGDGTVTLAKMADGTADTYLGYDESGAPAEKTLPVVVASGCVMPYAGPVVPAGWLLCDGSAVSRTTYADLFSAIGVLYGAGDSSTTFNLPDLRGRSIFGLDNMGGTAAERVTSGVSGIESTTLGASGGSEALHAHSHTVTDPGHTHDYTTYNNKGSGNAGSTLWANDTTGTTGSATTGITVDSAGDGDSENMPPAMMMNWIIKS